MSVTPFSFYFRNVSRLFSLLSVLHCSGPNRGHYITIVKSHGFWLLFDDDIVEVRETFSLWPGCICNFKYNQ